MRKILKKSSEDKIIKIPEDSRLLSMAMTYNPEVLDWEQFGSDYWIYDEHGNKMRKWYMTINNHKIWPPAVEDLAAIEERYHRMMSIRRTFYEEEWVAATIRIRDTKEQQAHALARYGHADSSDPWLLYKWSSYIGLKSDVGGISTDWVNTPAAPLNLEVGQHYHTVARKSNILMRRCQLFGTVFNYSLKQKLEQIKPDRMYNQMLQLIINDREYWFMVDPNRSESSHWKKVCWPIEKLKVVRV